MKAIILIHGFLSDCDDFAPFMDSAKQLYDYVEIVKIPGHGVDMGVHEFDIEKTYSLILKAYDDLDISYEIIDCVGYSMGGALAIYLSTVRKIRKLILLAPSMKYINYKFPIQIARTYFGLKHQIKISDGDPQIVDKMERINIDNKVSIKILKDRITHIKLWPRYYLSFRRIIKRINNEVKEIDSPTLLIWGELDQLVPKSSVEYVQSICTNKVKIIIIDDISHLMLLSPANVDKIITEMTKFIEEEVEDV
jgi:esterase/lipase